MENRSENINCPLCQDEMIEISRDWNFGRHTKTSRCPSCRHVQSEVIPGFEPTVYSWALRLRAEDEA